MTPRDIFADDRVRCDDCKLQRRRTEQVSYRDRIGTWRDGPDRVRKLCGKDSTPCSQLLHRCDNFVPKVAA